MNLRIDVYHHFSDADGDVLGKILTELAAIKAQGATIMSAADDMKARLDEIDAATNNLAADLQALKDLISTSMSAADVATVQARLDATSAALQALAAAQ